MSGFVSLQTALSALRAAQVGIDTTSHNVANANTTGYTRQRVNLENRAPYYSPAGPIGTGVEVASIARIRDSLLDARVRSTNSQLGYLSTLGEMTGRTEAVLSEPDQGISAQLSELWNAFDDAATNPANRASRIQVISALDSLAGRVRNIADGFDRLREDTGTKLTFAITEINTMLGRVAEVNNAIQQTAGIGTPNDLVDQRDNIVDQLATKLGISVNLEPNGTARLSVNGLTLVSGTKVNELTVGETAGVWEIGHPSGVPVVPGGELRGYTEYLNTWLPGQQTELDDFVEALATQLNTVHAQGRRETDGLPGGDLLTVTTGGVPGSVARSITVGVTQPEELAVGLPEDPLDPAPQFPATYDGRNAAALAATRNTIVGTATLPDSFRSYITAMGAGVRALQNEASAEGAISAAAEQARRNMQGVSLDEEMVALMSYQRAFEAAARVATAVDEAMGTLVNRVGVVGR